MNKQLLIVAHAPSPNTRKLAAALLDGARHPDIDAVEVRWSPPLETGPEAVLAAAAVILFTTENFGYMSGAMKDFFDRVYYPCLEQTQGLAYALVVRAGNDGEGARSSVERIIAGLRWKTAQPALICRGEFDDEWIARCEELGMAMAAGVEAGVF